MSQCTKNLKKIFKTEQEIFIDMSDNVVYYVYMGKFAWRQNISNQTKYSLLPWECFLSIIFIGKAVEDIF